MEEWLDVMQLAKQTNLPDTTVRRYLQKFNQFFTYKGGKRSRRYESSAIRVLLRIKALYAEGFETAEVAKTLNNEFPVVIDGEETEAKLDNAGLPALATAEEMAELKETLAKQNDLIQTLIRDNEEQKRFNESLLKALSSKEQQEINQKLLQELAELKQHQQLMLESLPEKEEAKEEQKEVAAVPANEEKKGFWSKFFK